jgi:glycosyltransferase involved in cell wall biosynthesis
LRELLRVAAIGASGQLGGTERVLLDLAANADDLGVDLRVVLPKGGPLIAALAERGVPAAVVEAPPRLLRSSQQPGHLWTAAPALFGLLQWSKRLRDHEFISNADLIYTISFKPHLAAVLGRLRPAVWHLHEFPPESTGGFWRFLARRIPDALIANSAAVAESWGPPTALPPYRLTAVCNGVDLDRFTPRRPTKWIHERLGIPPDRRLIGMPAVLAGWKGQREVVEAFRLIQDEFSDVDLVFVGGAIYDSVAEREYAAEIEELVGGRGEGRGERGEGRPAPPRVHLVPFQEDIEGVYPEFDVTVHYSTRPEPFGRVVLESMACGVPVIAADEGGPREILGGKGEGGGGWLVEPRNPEALARGLRDVLERSREELRVTGERGRRRAKELFSSRRFAEEVVAVFRSASVPVGGP